jgi:hypothetical protein
MVALPPPILAMTPRCHGGSAAVLISVRRVGQQQLVVHGIIIVTVRGEQQHASLLVMVAAHLEELLQVILRDGYCSQNDRFCSDRTANGAGSSRR